MPRFTDAPAELLASSLGPVRNKPFCKYHSIFEFQKERFLTPAVTPAFLGLAPHTSTLNCQGPAAATDDEDPPKELPSQAHAGAGPYQVVDSDSGPAASGASSMASGDLKPLKDGVSVSLGPAPSPKPRGGFPGAEHESEAASLEFTDPALGWCVLLVPPGGPAYQMSHLQRLKEVSPGRETNPPHSFPTLSATPLRRTPRGALLKVFSLGPLRSACPFNGPTCPPLFSARRSTRPPRCGSST